MQFEIDDVIFVFVVNSQNKGCHSDEGGINTPRLYEQHSMEAIHPKFHD